MTKLTPPTPNSTPETVSNQAIPSQTAANPTSSRSTSPKICSNAALELLLIQINSILPRDSASPHHHHPKTPNPLNAHAIISPSSFAEVC